MLTESCVMFFCRPEPIKAFFLRDHLVTGRREREERTRQTALLKAQV